MQISRRAMLRMSALSLLARTSWAARVQARESKAPVAPVRPVTDDIFSTKVTDPYRWMEKPDNPEFKAYLQAQAAYTRQVLDGIPGREALAISIARYTGGLSATKSPVAAGPYLFLQVRPPGSDTYKLQVRPRDGGDTRILIDPDLNADGKKRALNYWVPSPDGTNVAFGISESGSEDTVLQIIETASGRLLSERIDHTQYASPSWRSDGAGFYFNRLAGSDKAALDYYQHSVCWYHALGTDPVRDVRILAQGQSAQVLIADIEFPILVVAPGSNFALGMLIAGVQNELTLFTTRLNGNGAPSDWASVCRPADKITGATQRGDELFLLSYADAPRYKLLRTSASHPDLATAVVVVPEAASVLDNAYAAKDAVYLVGRNAGTSELRRLTSNNRIETIELPFPGTISDAFADPTQDGFWFELEGWTSAAKVCQVNASGVVIVTEFAPKPPYETSGFTSERIFATAPDGQKVPLSVIYKKGLKRDGSAPTILEAYGSYGLSIDPAFMTRYFAWLDLGGIYAVAHVRGGGELGRTWYEGGKKSTKPNSWHDLIACAQHLIADRWTSRKKLAIEGTSAGGIAVGRALTERPDLFGVVFSRVGVSNAARAEFSPNGPPNIPEFGSVTDPQTAQALLAMDAFYHVHDGTDYPSIMLTTGLTDPRVSPWQPGKMAARLRAATASKNPVLLRVEEEGGHGLGSTRSQFDLEYADLFAFALWRMGDARYQPHA